jgi:transcriptional regulator with XRE-family HTH domain
LHLQSKVKLPANPAYPATLDTLGDHLRKVRLDRGLSQSNVARILKVTTETVTRWELNRNQPTVKFVKAVIEFLGYVPFVSYDRSLENLSV